MKTTVMRINFFILNFCIVFAAGLYAQDFGFGFGDDAEGEEAASGSKSLVSVKVGGEAVVELAPYVHDFDEKGNVGAISFWDMISAKLNFNVVAGNVDAYTAFNLNAGAMRELWDRSPLLNDLSYTPKFMDEAFLRAFIGPVNIEAGLRKLSWGKADSLGPLDVINPLDYTDLRNISDLQAIKIARPLVHVTWNPGGFSKLEGVFIPNFSGHRFAREGRWAAAQFTSMADMVGKEIINGLSPYMAIMPPEYAPLIDSMYSQAVGSFSPEFPDTSGLNYFQTGLRFTATAGPADIGVQYFYGNLFQPDVIFPGVNAFINDLIAKNLPAPGAPLPGPSDLYTGNPALIYNIKYNRYHQIGVDYAQVLSGFNIRAELAFHLTEDFKGDDGAVRNPFIGWSLGFDRDLFWGINANV